jgi:hypothetical protein
MRDYVECIDVAGVGGSGYRKSATDPHLHSSYNDLSGYKALAEWGGVAMMVHGFAGACEPGGASLSWI